MHVHMYVHIYIYILQVFYKEQYHDIRVSFLYDIRNNAFSHDFPLHRILIAFFQNIHKASRINDAKKVRT